MPDGYLTVAGNPDRSINQLRMASIKKLPTKLAEPLIKMVNDILGRPHYTSKHAVIRLPAQPLHPQSYNVPDLEFLIKPGHNVDAKQLRDLLLDWFRTWFKKAGVTHTDSVRLFTTLDIIVEADRVCGVSYNLLTDEMDEWDENEE